MSQDPMVPPLETEIWRISMLNGTNAGKCFRLSEGELKTVGRSRDCAIHIPEIHVSRISCAFGVEAGRPVLHNYKPKKGIRINERTLSPDSTFELSEGDEVVLGGSDGVRLRVDREVVSVSKTATKRESIGRVSTSGPTAVTLEADAGTPHVIMETLASIPQAGKMEMDAPASAPVVAAKNEGGHEQETDETHVEIRSSDVTDDKTIVLSPSDSHSSEDITKFMPSDSTSPSSASQPTDPKTKDFSYPAEPAGGGNKLWKLAGGALVLFLLVLLWSSSDKTNPASVLLTRGEIARAWVPQKYHREIVGDSVAVTVDSSGSAGLALCSVEGPDITGVTFERWIKGEGIDSAPHMIERMHGRLSGLNWTLKADSPLTPDIPKLMSLPDRSSWFIELDGTSQAGAPAQTQALARLWLSGSHAVIAAIWWKSGDNDNSPARALLESVQVAIPPEFVFDRRETSLKPGDSPQGSNEQPVGDWLRSAESQLRNRSVDPANAWNAQQDALCAWRWAIANGHENEKTEAWTLLTEAAGEVQKEFVRLRFETVNALKLGQNEKALAACENIQRRIPDQSDFRWLWAEGQRMKIKPRKSGGLF